MLARHLLVIACSNRKRNEVGLIPAMDRYDGGIYRVIRKLRREIIFPMNIDVLILSAEFGLIEESTLIPNYDRLMTTDRAKEIRFQVQHFLSHHLTQQTYRSIYIDLSTKYLLALSGFNFPANTTLHLATGRIGERLMNVKNWIITVSNPVVKSE